MNITRIRMPAGRRRNRWLLTSLTEDLNSGLPASTNTGGGRSGT